MDGNEKNNDDDQLPNIKVEIKEEPCDIEQGTDQDESSLDGHSFGNILPPLPNLLPISQIPGMGRYGVATSPVSEPQSPEPQPDDIPDVKPPDFHLLHSGLGTLLQLSAPVQGPSHVPTTDQIGPRLTDDSNLARVSGTRTQLDPASTAQIHEIPKNVLENFGIVLQGNENYTFQTYSLANANNMNVQVFPASNDDPAQTQNTNQVQLLTLAPQIPGAGQHLSQVQICGLTPVFPWPGPNIEQVPASGPTPATRTPGPSFEQDQVPGQAPATGPPRPNINLIPVSALTSRFPAPRPNFNLVQLPGQAPGTRTPRPNINLIPVSALTQRIPPPGPNFGRFHLYRPTSTIPTPGPTFNLVPVSSLAPTARPPGPNFNLVPLPGQAPAARTPRPNYSKFHIYRPPSTISTPGPNLSQVPVSSLTPAARAPRPFYSRFHFYRPPSTISSPGPNFDQVPVSGQAPRTRPLRPRFNIVPPPFEPHMVRPPRRTYSRVRHNRPTSTVSTPGPDSSQVHVGPSAPANLELTADTTRIPQPMEGASTSTQPELSDNESAGSNSSDDSKLMLSISRLLQAAAGGDNTPEAGNSDKEPICGPAPSDQLTTDNTMIPQPMEGASTSTRPEISDEESIGVRPPKIPKLMFDVPRVLQDVGRIRSSQWPGNSDEEPICGPVPSDPDLTIDDAMIPQPMGGASSSTQPEFSDNESAGSSSSDDSKLMLSISRLLQAAAGGDDTPEAGNSDEEPIYGPAPSDPELTTDNTQTTQLMEGASTSTRPEISDEESIGGPEYSDPEMTTGNSKSTQTPEGVSTPIRPHVPEKVPVRGSVRDPRLSIGSMRIPRPTASASSSIQPQIPSEVPVAGPAPTSPEMPTDNATSTETAAGPSTSTPPQDLIEVPVGGAAAENSESSDPKLTFEFTGILQPLPGADHSNPAQKLYQLQIRSLTPKITIPPQNDDEVQLCGITLKSFRTPINVDQSVIRVPETESTSAAQEDDGDDDDVQFCGVVLKNVKPERDRVEADIRAVMMDHSYAAQGDDEVQICGEVIRNIKRERDDDEDGMRSVTSEHSYAAPDDEVQFCGEEPGPSRAPQGPRQGGNPPPRKTSKRAQSPSDASDSCPTSEAPRLAPDSDDVPQPPAGDDCSERAGSSKRFQTPHVQANPVVSFDFTGIESVPPEGDGPERAPGPSADDEPPSEGGGTHCVGLCLTETGGVRPFDESDGCPDWDGEDDDVADPMACKCGEIRRHRAGFRPRVAWHCSVGYCPATFEHESERNRHERSHRSHPTRAFQCRYCGKRFSFHSYWLKHAKVCHRIEKLTCPDCEYSTQRRSLLKRHAVKHSGRINCTECKRIYAHIDKFVKHVSDNHRKEVFFQCTECPKSFSLPDNLARHIETHDMDLDKCGVTRFIQFAEKSPVEDQE